MSDNKRSFIGIILLPVAVIAITIVVFFLLKPQETTALFWINLFYTVFLEAVFFGYLNVMYLKSSDLSSPFYAVFGMYCFYYIVLGAGCMVAYGLMVKFFYTPDTNRVYFALLMLITLLWIIVSEMNAQTDSNLKRTVESLKERGISLNYLIQKITLLTLRYERLCVKKGLRYETLPQNRTELDRLKGKITFLTPNVFNNDAAVVKISALIVRCEDLVIEMEGATKERAPAVQTKMQRFVDNAITELDVVKNLARR